ncbi:hypothetical protein HNQ92_000864 [Rhabdobacter roseus]|uniref:Lipoprotein n=1 Tax=Rhabdobacter roseus TaxID=1655419 RepID=A0A840TNF3_9BACT|nr:hypothetical protein [Rhabdobacter roseus]MBB5282743.1 hypothetical protein [Rhabdobacter roseus]
MKKYIGFGLILLSAWACEPAPVLAPEGLTALQGSRCIYDNRTTVRQLDKQVGTVRITATASNWWIDIYVDGDEETPYCPCNLPKELSEGGTRVEFNAELKEILAGEDGRCQPIRLTYVIKVPQS